MCSSDLLTYAQHNSKESTNGQATQVFADYVNENSDTLQIDVYYNGELGGIQEAVEGVAMGTIDATASSFAQLSSLYTEMELFSIPYLVKNGEDNKKLMDMANNDVLREILYKGTLTCRVERKIAVIVSDKPVGTKVRALMPK